MNHKNKQIYSNREAILSGSKSNLDTVSRAILSDH